MSNKNKRKHKPATQSEEEPKDPLAHITPETIHASLNTAAAGGSANWLESNNSASASIAVLMRLASHGNNSAKRSLLDLAIGITRHLHEHHSDLVPLCREFPVVLSAELEKRKSESKEHRLLPIGAQIGFPQARDKRHPSTYDESPAGFWREIQWMLDGIRNLALQFPANQTPILDGKDGSISVPIALQQKIASLPNFGDGSKEEWFQAACNLVAENPETLLPEWVRKLSTAGKKKSKQRGLGDTWERALEKGFRYCWDTA